MKRFRTAFLIVTTLASIALLAPGASARYTLHNSADVTQADVVNGSEFNTCGNRISGRSGWSSFSTLEQLGGTLPPEATGPASYEVFQFPAGRDPSDFQFVFDVAGGSYVIYGPDGTTIIETAPRVLAFDTAPRVVVPGGPIDQEGLFIYTDVAFDEAIAPAAPVGSTLGIKPLGGASLLELTVVDCAPTEQIVSIDAQPGKPGNPVNPASGRPTLVILVKGSRVFDVTKIATARVGTATPVTSGDYWLLSRPKDLNGDGFKDRRYYFRPNQTGLTCASTSVTIRGTLRSGSAWSGTDRIKPTYCV